MVMQLWYDEENIFKLSVNKNIRNNAIRKWRKKLFGLYFQPNKKSLIVVPQ